MSGHLPFWLAERLGLKLPSGTDDATWQLDSAWNWAPWATLLLLAFVIFWTVFLYRRESATTQKAYRALLSGLRIAAIGLLLVMLAQWVLAVKITGPPGIALVIDRSASMSVADHYDDATITALRESLAANDSAQTTRLNYIKQILTHGNGELLRELLHRYRTEIYFLAGGLERCTPAANSEALVRTINELNTNGPGSDVSRIGDGLMLVLDDFRDAPPAAIVLFSDGVTTEGKPLAAAAEEARRKGVPIYAIGVGRDAPPRDIELSDVLVDDVVFVNDTVNLQAQVKASDLEGESAKITLRREGSDAVLAEQSILLPANGISLSVRLNDRPTQSGDITYIVEIATRDDEVEKQNNRLARVVSVRDVKIRVLLAQGYPSYEFRFLKTLLEREPTVELNTYLQDADPDYAAQDKTALRSFPVSRDELASYDAVLVGDIDPRLVPRSAWQSLRSAVAEKGTGVAFIAGPRFLPWSYQGISDVTSLLPIDIARLPLATTLPPEVTSGFVVSPTLLGLQSPPFQLGDTLSSSEQIWHNLAPLYWLFPVEVLKPGAQVLAEGPRSTSGASRANLPVICFQYVGAGRALFHAIDSTWRWRIGGGEPFFARYWVQTVRFLARGKLSQGRGVEITPDRREYHRGDTPQIRVRFLDTTLSPTGDTVAIVVETPGQDRRRANLRRNSSTESVFEGTLPDLPVGRYEVALMEPILPGKRPAAQFAVVAPPGEFAHPEMDAAALAAAADVTHGKFFTLLDADRLLAELPTGRRVPIENLPPISIWNRWWLLTAFLVCLTTEWILRKRKGMI
jgi:hypothetical protein